jgi:arginyl-tRNA synthetase
MIQMVRVIKDGKEYKMSKRKGTAVWLVDILEVMGKDALRYMLASKASSSHMDLDLDLIKQKNASNPVYYAQYATARLNSILRQAKEQKLVANVEPNNLLKGTKELELLILLDNFSEIVRQAALNRAPNIMTDYIQKVATFFHSYYSESKIIDLKQLELTQARLGLVEATLQVLSNAFDLIGLNVVQEM